MWQVMSNGSIQVHNFTTHNMPHELVVVLTLLNQQPTLKPVTNNLLTCIQLIYLIHTSSVKLMHSTCRLGNMACSEWTTTCNDAIMQSSIQHLTQLLYTILKTCVVLQIKKIIYNYSLSLKLLVLYFILGCGQMKASF